MPEIRRYYFIQQSKRNFPAQYILKGCHTAGKMVELITSLQEYLLESIRDMLTRMYQNNNGLDFKLEEAEIQYREEFKIYLKNIKDQVKILKNTN